MCRIEKLSFNAYNEGTVLKTAIENYKERSGHYPERFLADQIYRNRDNIALPVVCDEFLLVKSSSGLLLKLGTC